MKNESAQRVKSQKNEKEIVICDELFTKQAILSTRLSKRIFATNFEKTLEALHTFTETECTTLESQCDLAAQCISDILKCDFAAAAILTERQISHLSWLTKSKPDVTDALAQRICEEVYRKRGVFRISGDLNFICTDSFGGVNDSYKGLLGIPVIGSCGQVAAVICALDKNPAIINGKNVKILKVIAGILSNKLDLRNQREMLLPVSDEALLRQITSGLAHEVRNPINGILSLSEALQMDLGSRKEYVEFFDLIISQTERLSILTKELLELGTPLDKSKMKPFSVTLICREALEFWKCSSTGQNQTIKFRQPLEEYKCFVLADKARLISALKHLLDNAARHSDAGSEIVFDIAEHFESSVILRIIDQGCGIPKNIEDRIFEPFFTSERGHYGLGLSIVKKLISAHGGTVTVKNNFSGHGCTAGIKLPVFK